MAHIEL